jgi:hypothetical protein
VDDFYAARSRTIPPLPWSNIAPPFSDVHQLLILGHIEVGDQTGMADRRAIDENIKTTERRDGLAHGARDRIRVCAIGLYRSRLPPQINLRPTLIEMGAGLRNLTTAVRRLIGGQPLLLQWR